MPRIQVGALTVDYCEAGTGTPVVFVPGITEFKEAFIFQYRGLGNSYRIVSYDVRRGLKRSADYSLDLLVNDLKRVLDSLRLDSAVICGHSFGGLIAIQFALQFPEKTRALILVSAFAAAPTVTPDCLLGWISSASHPFHRSFSMSLKVQISRLLGSRTLGAIGMQDEVAAVKSIAQQAVKTSRTTIDQRMQIIQTADFRSDLVEIQSPALVVAGANDRPFFLSSAQELYEGIPNAALDVIEGGGHFCFLTRHDRFNATVDEFLKDHVLRL